MSVHALHVASNGEQPHPTAYNLGIDGIGSTEELLEEFALFASTDAYAVVDDMESPAHGMTIEANGNGSSIVAILDGIGDEVLNDGV